MGKGIIAIASDHAGVALKALLVKDIAVLGYEADDLGPDSDASVDYPDYAEAVAAAIESGNAKFGILICGSGIGMSIAANRYPGVRAALCHSVETATLSRQHNDANILVLGARIVSEALAQDCLKAFLATEFEGGRHQRRVDKLG